MRCGGAVIGGRDHADGWAADSAPAKDAQRRAQRVRRVDQGESRPERAVGAVQVELDGPVPAGVQRQQRGRCLRRRVVVEPTGDEHDAALEELLLEPRPRGSCPKGTTRSSCGRYCRGGVCAKGSLV